MLEKSSKIYIAGHRGLVGSAIWNNLKARGYNNLIGRTHHELDLTNQQAVEDFFAEDKEEQTFFAGGKELSAKLIADAIHSLPEEKRRAVLLYYFFDMSDAEIAELYQIPRSTV